MGRIFRRGELKQAILVVLESIEPARGYAVMSDLKERVGGSWKPSPGAIYPALLALVMEDLVAGVERDGKLLYSLTDSGRQEVRTSTVAKGWASLNARAERGEERATVGSLLDTFAADNRLRRRLTDADQRQAIESIFMDANEQIAKTMNRGGDNG